MTLRRIAIQMDPPERLNPRGDSTIALAEAAVKRGAEIVYFHPRSLSLQPDGTLSAQCFSLQIDRTTLDLAFNGVVDPEDYGYIVPSAITAVERALFILAVDGTERLGLYNPRASITLGDAP